MKLNKLPLTILLITIINSVSFAQTWQWGRSSISNTVNCFSSDVDNKGNVWIAGNYGGGTVNFSGLILPAPTSSSNIFLTNYDKSGNVLFAKHFESVDVNVFGIKCDLDNNIYLSGNFLGTLNLDTITLNTGFVPAAFVCKTDSVGNVIWGKKLSYPDVNGFCIIDIDSLSNLIAIGNYEYLSGSGFYNTFIEKLDSSGNTTFQTTITGVNNNASSNGLYVDYMGNYYISGTYDGNATLNSISINSSGGANMYIAKYSINDSLLWFRNYGTSFSANPGAIASDGNRIYFTYNSEIVSLNASGDSIWNAIIGNPSNTNLGGHDLEIDGHNVVVSGTYSNSQIIIGSISFPFAVNNNLFVAELDSNGNYNWGIFSISTGSCGPFSSAIAGNDIFIEGHFGGLLTPVYLYIGNDTLLSNSLSKNEVFITKLSTPILLPVVAVSCTDTNFCEKQCINFFDLSTNNPTSWQWFFPGADSTTSSVQNPTNICYSTYGSFDVTLIACNAAGCDTLILPGFINEYPLPTATITQSNDTLFSSPGVSYQWYSVATGSIAGATNNYFVPAQTGDYYVIVTDSIGCAGTSNIISITGFNEFSVDNFQLRIVPNPNKGSFTISLNDLLSNDFSICITDPLGRRITNWKATINGISPNRYPEFISIDFLSVPKGFYSIILKNNNCVYRGKIIVE